ncbi:MAG: hemerythrin family protein [Gammaproteobacteria bacterium]|nr:hemerythrin family protein [Gammaproteobacteria bacterium]
MLEKEDQQLIGLLNALDKSVSDGDSASHVYDYLNDFVTLAEKHFKNEDVIMKDYKYPEITSHKKEHADLLGELFNLKNKLGQGYAPFGKHYMQFLKSWLDKHLSSADNRRDEFLYQVNANKDK